MNRRNFFSQSASAAISSNNLLAEIEEPTATAEHNQYMNKAIPKVPRSSAGLEPYTGPWGNDQASHLLRRTMFTATKADTDAILKKSMGEAVDALLAVSPDPNPPVAFKDETYTDSGTGKVTTGVNAGETWVYSTYQSVFESQRTQSLQGWWMGLIINASVSIREKMVLFWHNHFVSEFSTVGDSRFMYKQNALFRQYALGNFKNLARDITLDPAMLRYLNGNTNTKGSPNENYGRELQELFTIGKGPEISPGNYTTYTEDDVKAAAHVLTGWKDVRDPIGTAFTLSLHDGNDKQFSSNYGNAIVKGTSTGEPGARREIDDLLTIIFSQDATAKYICRKLYRWFVYYIIDDTTEQNVITPMANVLKSNNFEIAPVLSALLKSAHFYDPVNIGCVIKNPVDHIAGTMRLLPVLLPDATMPMQQYSAWMTLVNSASSQQQILLDPPNVAGWPAYYQEPAFYEIWITSDTLPKRNQFTDALIASGYVVRDAQGKNPFTVKVDLIALVQSTSNAADPNIIINEFAQRFYPIPLLDTQKTYMKENVLIPGLPDYEWSNEWADYLKDTTNAANKKKVNDRLVALVKFMMDIAEYQLM